MWYRDFMVGSNSGTTNRSVRGRPVTTGPGTSINVRLHDDGLADLDAWIERQSDRLSRPEAIRRLVAQGLAR